MKKLLESIIVIVPDLQYLRARYYDPNMGRFMQQDTLFGELNQPLTQNLYIYCLNNGVNLRDPSGNRSVDSIKSDINRYKDQLASAKSAGAGQSVYDGIQKTIDSLIKELGNELSKPKPNPSPKPPKKPDWGDTSNPYNPVNNPNSVGSILSGADGYWGNGGGSSSSGGGGYAPTQEDAMREAEAKRKAEAEKKKIHDELVSGNFFNNKDLSKKLDSLSLTDRNSILALQQALQAYKGDGYMTSAVYNEMCRILGVQSIYPNDKTARFKYEHDIYSADDIKKLHQRDSIILGVGQFIPGVGAGISLIGGTINGVSQDGKVPVDDIGFYLGGGLLKLYNEKFYKFYETSDVGRQLGKIFFEGRETYVEDGYRIKPGDGYTYLEIDYNLGTETRAFDTYFTGGNISNQTDTGNIFLGGDGRPSRLEAEKNRWRKDGYIGR